MMSKLSISEAYSYDMTRELISMRLNERRVLHWKKFGKSVLGDHVIGISNKNMSDDLRRMNEAMEYLVDLSQCFTFTYS